MFSCNLHPEAEDKELGKISFIYVNDFSEQAAKSFVLDFEKALNNNQDVVPIIIDSYGGAVDSLSVMMDVIDSSPIPVATICLGKAMSAGAFLLSCGNEGLRFASPNSRIMIHNVSAFSMGKVPDMKIDTKEAERLEKLFFEIMAKNCKKKKNYFINLIKKNSNADLFMTPKEALKHNIVNHVKVPHFRTAIAIKSEIVL